MSRKRNLVPPDAYIPSPSDLSTLIRTFWTASGWRSATESTVGLPTTHQVIHAVNAGLMFVPGEWVVRHDETVESARKAASKVDHEEVAAAFLTSLLSRRLDLRSALGSYALVRHLPYHGYEGSGQRCRICGLAREGTLDLNVLNFERFKWGGVRRDNIAYAAFDLHEFGRAPREELQSQHADAAWSVFAALEALPAETTATAAMSQLAVLKGNRQERAILLDILGVCGVLETAEYHGYADSFVHYARRKIPDRHNVERAYPVCWWRAKDGVNRAHLREFLPQIF